MSKGNIDVADILALNIVDILALNQELEAENERLKLEAIAQMPLYSRRRLKEKNEQLEAENTRLKVAFTRAHDLAEIVADEFQSDDGWGAYETYPEKFEFLRDERIAIDKKTADRIEVK